MEYISRFFKIGDIRKKNIQLRALEVTWGGYYVGKIETRWSFTETDK